MVSGESRAMPKRSSIQKDTQQLARSVLDAIVPDAEPVAAQPKKNPPQSLLGVWAG